MLRKIRQLFRDFLGEIVYGAIDGIVSTFAIVAAAAGAGFTSTVIIIMGVANLVADGVSMGISAYLSERTEVAQYRRQRRAIIVMLEKQIEHAKGLIRKHFTQYGFKQAQLDSAVDTVAKEDERAVEFILKHEYEMAEEPESARAIGLATFTAFMIAGLVPLSAYITDAIFDLNSDGLFLTTSILAGVSFIGVGYLKNRFTQSSVLISVLETLILGAVAAGVAYGIGFWLETVIA